MQRKQMRDTDALVVTNISFETGSARLKDLEKKVYVGSGRFILEEGKPVNKLPTTSLKRLLSGC